MTFYGSLQNCCTVISMTNLHQFWQHTSLPWLLKRTMIFFGHLSYHFSTSNFFFSLMREGDFSPPKICQIFLIVNCKTCAQICVKFKKIGNSVVTSYCTCSAAQISSFGPEQKWAALSLITQKCNSLLSQSPNKVFHFSRLLLLSAKLKWNPLEWDIKSWSQKMGKSPLITTEQCAVICRHCF